MRVTLYLRHPRPNEHSIEEIVSTLKVELEGHLPLSVWVSPYPSKGVIPRLRSLLSAWKMRSEVNHVTGDEHFLVLALPRRSSILTIHDLNHLESLRGLRGKLARLLWLHLPVRQSHVVTTISEASRQQVIRLTGCAPAKVTVIPNPLGSSFAASPPANNRRPRLLAIGTRPNKNLEGITSALEGLDAELHILGSPTEAHIRQLRSHGVDAVCHAGLSMSGVAELYRQCDLVVFPSLAEGFGMPIIEAQASGRPVVTSDLSPMKEVAGGAAVLVDPHSIASIREGIELVLNDVSVRSGLIEQGIENAKTYERSAVARRYEALYRSVAPVTSSDSRKRLS